MPFKTRLMAGSFFGFTPSPMFWDSASDLLRVLAMAPLAYAALIVVLRLSGKRMLSKMSAFDLVVTIALGSTLATILLSKDVAFAEGLAALCLLIGLQYLVAWSTARSARVRRIVQSKPTLLYFNGQFLAEALREENLSVDSVRAAMREKGFARIEEVSAVVLEADGGLSVLAETLAEPTALADVRHPPPWPPSDKTVS